MEHQKLATIILESFVDAQELQTFLARVIYPAFRSRRARAVAQRDLVVRCRHHHSGLPMTHDQYRRLTINDMYWFVQPDGLWKLYHFEKAGRRKIATPGRSPAQPCPFGDDPYKPLGNHPDPVRLNSAT